MLFLASRVLSHELNNDERLRLLENLEERNIAPLIRSMRLSCYDMALASLGQVEEMERLIARSANLDTQTPYVRGDIFCFDDYVFFLIFENEEYGAKGMRAGIVYERRTAEPLRKLDYFCHAVSLFLSNGGHEINKSSSEAETTQLITWSHNLSDVHKGFMRFIARQDSDSLYTFARTEAALQRIRAAELLDDIYTRNFLHCLKEATGEGYSLGLSAAVGENSPPEFSASRLVEAGLLEREVLVICRQTGHTLFSLPSSDALAAITVSAAKCSECGSKIVDEKIEEAFVPTLLASRLLDDGAWLVNRLYAILREFGVPDSEIAIEPPTGDGEARMMVNVCDEPFLLVLRDGDLTPAFARRAVDIKIGTDARHLVIIVTGAIHKEGRHHLLNFAKRLNRRGSDFELIIGEGVSAAALELEYAFKRVSQKALVEQLCELDDSLGISVAQLLTTRFQLLRETEDATRATQLAVNRPTPAMTLEDSLTAS